MTYPVFDLHCDTALALLGDKLDQTGDLARNAGHWDLERASTMPGFAQCFACFTTPEMSKWYGKSPITVFEMELAGILYQIEKNKDRIALAYNGDDIVKNQKKGVISAILTVEGPAGFDYDPALLRDLYAIGFRITTLGWNESNCLTGSNLTGEGLTEQGKEYVRQAQKLGMLIDVSHISDKGFWDIMEITQAPVIASHSNSRAVCNVGRNLSDDMFKAIMHTGGVVGLNLYADFIGEHADLNQAADHVLHFLEMDPDGTHIALGGDLDGCEQLPEGFCGVQDYPSLAERLIARGVSSEIVQNIFWNNALGVINHAVHLNKK